MNPDEGASGIEINFPRLTVQDISGKINFNDPESKLQNLMHEEEAGLFPSSNSSDGVLSENGTQSMYLGNVFFLIVKFLN